MQEIIKKLNLEPLNIFDNSQLSYDEADDMYRCNCKISNVDCKVAVLSFEIDIGILVSPFIDCDDTEKWLKKINRINLAKNGSGVVDCIYIDDEENVPVLQTNWYNLGTVSPESKLAKLNIAIAAIPGYISELCK